MDIRQRFGDAIRDRRSHLGVSQEELADLTGLDRTYISGIERGRRNPTLAIIQKLTHVLDVDLNAVFREEHEQKG